MTPALTRVDHSALKVNQVAVVVLTASAFIFDQVWLVGGLALVLLLGSVLPQAALFGLLYRHLLRPTGLVRPDLREDSPAPHRFAQLLGGSMLLAAAAALLNQAVLLGWLLTGVVTFLAALNLFSGFCAGCFLYFQFSRLRSGGQ